MLPRVGLRASLPVIIGSSTGLVNSTEDEFHFLTDFHVLRINLDDLKMDLGAVDIDDGNDRRRIRGRKEEVEGKRDDFADSVGKRYDSMISSGKLRTAVRTVTSRGKNGLFKPHDIDEKSGLRVVDVIMLPALLQS